ncbi:MAG: hypothetical protein QOI63_359 [Thermoplasmata archaeon]|jgi:hypothetical protein|nr:hypothetical protein [Thermoplasmata archaeon]
MPVSPSHHVPRIWAWVALAAAIAFPGPAAAMSLTQGIATTPMAKGPEETLLAGDAGTAALGASGTSATTSLATATASAQSILRIHAASGTWSIHILCSATGFGASDSAIVALEGTTVSDQCLITNGALAQASGTPLGHAAGTDLRVTLQGSKVSGSASTLTMAIILVHAGDGAISLAYPYTLNLNP